MPTLEVLFTPADFSSMAQRDLANTVCVVFDVLRATSSMVTALANGAQAIVPVAEISEALDLRANRDVLLAGEREGVRITRELTGSINFDLGNSPREFSSAAVRSRVIVMTTTNGTRALRACSSAREVFVSSFLNLKSTAMALKNLSSDLLVVCSGTFEQAAYEDVLAAGALCEQLWTGFDRTNIADSALMASRLFALERSNLLGALSQARNGQRLMSRSELREDVAFCCQLDSLNVVAKMGRDGRVVAERAGSRVDG